MRTRRNTTVGVQAGGGGAAPVTVASPTAAGTLAALLFLAAAAAAVQTSTWKQGGVADFGEAESTHVAVAADGSARLAPRRELLHGSGEAYIWCLASGPDGTVYAGTGDDGLVVAIPRVGEPSVLHDSIELQILSLAVGPDGAVYAGGSPDGSILRIADGQATTYFDTPESYVWALEFGTDGALYAATGDRGRLYRITAAGQGGVYYTSAEVHLLCMVKDGDDLVVGTAPSGQVLRVMAPDSALVLYDAAEEEVKALARAADGTLYVGAVGKPGRDQGEKRARNGHDWSSVVKAVSESENGDGSHVYRIAADGAVQRFWRSTGEMVLALEPDPLGGLWVGTGSRGTLVRLDGRGTATRLFQTDEEQVVAIRRTDAGLVIGTANPGNVYRVGPGVEDEGLLESEIFDARNVAAWGRIRWQATIAPGTAIRLHTRSGNTEIPDATWSGWSPALRDASGEPIPSPAARFIQWRARLVGSGSRSPVLESVSVAYLEHNLPPHLHGLDVVVSSGSLTSVDFDVAPDRVGQTLPTGVQVEFSYPHSPEQRVRLDQVAWLRGTRVASWVADDPNADELRFDVYLKAEDETSWKLLVEDFEEQIYAFRTADLDDGRYRAKVVATDSRSNPPGAELADSLVSRPFVIDNTSPRIAALRAQRQTDGRLLVTGEVVDALSVIVSLQVSVDADDWLPVFPEDSIFDAREESFRFTVAVEDPDREHRVLVRAADELGNVAARKVVVP